eukprot:gene4153-14251_t
MLQRFRSHLLPAGPRRACGAKTVGGRIGCNKQLVISTCCVAPSSESSEVSATVRTDATPETILQTLTSSGAEVDVAQAQVLALSADAFTRWSGSQLVQLATALEQHGSDLEPEFRSALLAALGPALKNLTLPHLSKAAWAGGELGGDGSSEWLDALVVATTKAMEDEFLAPDLAALTCTLGAQSKQGGYEVPETLVNALRDEAYYQLNEFMSDFSGKDIARILIGLADLGVQASGETANDMHYVVMKAVYSQLKTIEDKAAVDFALGKLDTGKSSLFYDTRWTYEEMGWLPRCERDKRRIINENFERGQWGGV